MQPTLDTRLVELIASRARRILCLSALLVACQVSHVAGADELWPYARVTCDSRKGDVKITQEYAESQDDIPKKRAIADLYALTILRTAPVESLGIQDFRVPAKSFRYTCTVNKSQVTVRIDPWKFQPRISGMCGADAPNVKLNLWSDHIRIVRDFIFSGQCSTPDAAIEVRAITLHLQDRVAVIEFIDNNDPVDRVYRRTVPFPDLLKFDRETFLRGYE